MDSSLLLPREQYAEQSRLHGPLPTFEIIQADHCLFFFGANHAGDPQNEQYQKLRQRWNEFIVKIRNSQRDAIVLIEGHLLPVLGNEEEAIRYGREAALSIFWAAREGIRCACPEPPHEHLTRTLRKSFSKDEIALYYFCVAVDGWHRKPKDAISDFEQYMTHALAWYRDNEVGWPNYDWSFENIKNTYERILNIPFDKKSDFNTLHNPNIGGTIVNDVARAMSDIRDLHIASEIERYWNEGKNIFVVFGSGHLIIQEPALRASLK
jgi:hypothetical protein